MRSVLFLKHRSGCFRKGELKSGHCDIQLVQAVLQDVPVADAKADDIKDLLGGALFKALYKWMEESGPVYLLPTGSLLYV